MNKINPIYAPVILLIAFLLVLFSNIKKEENIQEAKINNLILEKKAKELKKLKQDWGSKDATLSKINNITSDTALSKKILDKSSKGEVYKISFGELSDKEIDLLADKLLNQALKINSLSVKSAGDSNATAFMEIGI